MPNLSESRIGQIAIVCRGVGRARDFYRDALGVKHLFDAGPTLSFFQSGTTRLMLSTAEGDATGTSVLYFFVSNIEATASELKGKGVEFVDQPHMIAKMPDHELWLVAFRDSEGNLLALMEERR